MTDAPRGPITARAAPARPVPHRRPHAHLLKGDKRAPFLPPHHHHAKRKLRPHTKDET